MGSYRLKGYSIQQRRYSSAHADIRPPCMNILWSMKIASESAKALNFVIKTWRKKCCKKQLSWLLKILASITVLRKFIFIKPIEFSRLPQKCILCNGNSSHKQNAFNR